MTWRCVAKQVTERTVSVPPFLPFANGSAVRRRSTRVLWDNVSVQTRVDWIER